MSKMIIRSNTNNFIKNSTIFKITRKKQIIFSRLYKESLFFKGLLGKDYGILVFFSSTEDALKFHSFLKDKRVRFMKMRLKSTFLKFNTVACMFPTSYIMTMKGGTSYYVFSKQDDLFTVMLYFLQDNVSKDILSKGFSKKDFLTKLNSMAGNIISVKILNFFFPFNYSFFKFFLFSIESLKQTSQFFILFFIKITMVILYSIMLIILLYKAMLFKFLGITFRSFFFITSYANKKPIN